jgi:hypothetical protein
VLDKNDTIKMRNLGFLKGSYKLYSTIYKLFSLSFFFQDRSRTASRSSKNSSTYPVTQKHSRRRLPAAPCSVSTACCKTNRHETGDNVRPKRKSLTYSSWSRYRGLGPVTKKSDSRRLNSNELDCLFPGLGRTRSIVFVLINNLTQEMGRVS